MFPLSTWRHVDAPPLDLVRVLLPFDVIRHKNTGAFSKQNKAILKLYSRTAIKKDIKVVYFIPKLHPCTRILPARSVMFIVPSHLHLDVHYSVLPTTFFQYSLKYSFTKLTLVSGNGHLQWHPPPPSLKTSLLLTHCFPRNTKARKLQFEVTSVLCQVCDFLFFPQN